VTLFATIQPTILLTVSDVLTDQHIAETLSRAYICAIAGRAGLNLAIREYDYGVGGSFDGSWRVKIVGLNLAFPSVFNSEPRPNGNLMRVKLSMTWN
jgi:hypothetical protein